MHLFYRLFATVNSFAPTILRLLLAFVLLAHWGEKTVGWMGGSGWSATLTQWTSPAPQGLNLTYPVAVLGIAVELIGALALLLGLCTRPAAILLVGFMAVAISLVHWQAGFPAPKGYEYPMTLGGVALSLIFSGGGRLSLDRALTRQLLPPRGSSAVLGKFENYRMQSIIKQ